jgi:hypothetical protein
VSDQPEVQVGPVTKVARDLTEILDLYARLVSQAIRHGGNGRMPGGPAMVALGDVANMEAWENMNQATERHDLGLEGYRRAYTSVESEDPDHAWSAFQLLEFWSEQWRREHGAEYGKRPTIATEANFIRYMLDWAWDNEPAWDDFTADVNRARLRLEDIVHAGQRVERSRVECDQCGTRLIVLRHLGAEDDAWKCPKPECHKRFDRSELNRAHAKMLRSSGADRWVHQVDAIWTLKGQGRPERTIRQWLADGEGEGYCDPITHEVWVWWPSLWIKHCTTPTRSRESRRQDA